MCQVVGDLMLRIQRIPDFTPKLLLVRKRLLGLEPEGVMYVPAMISEVFVFWGDFFYEGVSYVHVFFV